MDKQVIQQLLDSYFEGKTSLEQERQLKAYFSAKTVAPELEQYKSLFVFLKEEQKQSISEDFSFQQHQQTKIKQMRTRRFWWSVAASVCLLVVSWWSFNNNSSTTQSQQQAINWEAYEASDEEAIRLTLSALKRTSKAMKKGTLTIGSEVKNIKNFIKK